MPPKRTRGPRTPRLGALGTAIEEARKAAGLSQERLGHQSELYGSHISALERGFRNPTYETLVRLAEALDTTVGELTSRADVIHRTRES